MTETQNTPNVKPDLPKLMVVEDDPGLQRQMVWALSDDFDVAAVGDRTCAREAVEKHQPQLVVLDLGLPPDPNGSSEGLAILADVLERRPNAKVIIASGNEERSNALRAISLGAHDFFSKPVDVDALKLTLKRAKHVQDLEDENRRLLHAAQGPLDGIISSSKVMADICDTVRRVAKTDVCVLILGESGTGKELVARAVHTLSPRASGPFVATNCAAIPENLLESELFGYERGAFTGAVKRTMGKIEAASGGTLFLDEIGDMPLALQAKLLRFLQDHTFQRLGSQQDQTADLRIVAASNRDLKNMIGVGTFREDLYFRLNEIGVMLPPLRERAEDAVLIAQALTRRFAELYKRPHARLSGAGLAAISNYTWPGNVRELENRLKRAVLMARDDVLTAEDLGLGATDGEPQFPTLKDARNQAEAEIIRKVIAAYNNNLSHAAKVLGVSRPTLYGLLSNHGINVDNLE